VLEVGTQRNRERQSVGQTPLDKAETDLKDAQVAAVGSIYKRASTTMDGTATLRDMQGDLGGKDIEIRVSLDNSKIPPSSM
jgi:hypothetical protein